MLRRITLHPMPSVPSLVLGLVFIGFPSLWAQNPFAGTYRATITRTESGVDSLPISDTEFTVENDGSFVINSAASGTVAADGTITFAGGANSSGLTSGRADAAGMTAAQMIIPTLANHPPFILRLNAPRAGDLLPAWANVTPTSGLPTAGGSIPYNLQGVVFGNGKFLSLVVPTIKSGVWSALTSPDGVSWSNNPIPLGLGSETRIYNSLVRFVNGKFWFGIFGDSYGGPTLRFFSSTDGVAWTYADTGLVNKPVVDITYAFGKYWAHGGITTQIWNSADGVVWSPVSITGEVTDLTRWLTGNGLLVAMPRGSAGIPNAFNYVSSDGVNWMKKTYPDLLNAGFASFGGGRFVSAAVKTSLSTDFSTFTAALPGPNNTSDGFQAYSPFTTQFGWYDGGYHYNISQLTSPALYRSTDGNEWRKTVRLAPGTTPFFTKSVAVGNGHAVVIGDSFLYSATLPGFSGYPVVSAPVELTPMSNVSTTVGGSASFVGSFAHGGLLLTYQWQQDGVDIPGATNVSYFFNPVTATSAGKYTLTARNAVGSAISKVVTLTAPGAPVISSFSPSTTVVDGASFSVNAYASGAATLTRQWRFNSFDIPGATSVSLTRTASAATAGSYDCVITNSYGSATCPAIKILVLSGVAPLATTGPRFLSIPLGGGSTFAAGITGPLPITYQWTKDGGNLFGQTADSLTLGGVIASDAGIYQVSATNGSGTTLGAPISVVIAPPVPYQLLGRPLVKIVNSNSARPGGPAGATLGTIGAVRFRDQTVIFQAAAPTSTTVNGIFRWKNDALSVIASSAVTAPNGQAFANCTDPTEEVGGIVYFVGAHAAAPLSSIYSWQSSSGVFTALLQAGALAPGGGHFTSFSYLAARSGKLYFLGQVLDAPNPGKKLFRRDAGGAITLVIEANSELPGSMGKFVGEALGTLPFSYDGQRLVAAFGDSSGQNRGVFLVREDASVTPLISSADTLPGTNVRFTSVGNGDSEAGGAVFAGGYNYDASFNADDTMASLSNSGGSVSAIDGQSYLSTLFNSVNYRRGSMTLPVVDGTQALEGLAIQSVTPEAHGTETAFRVSFTNTNQSIYVALDRPATALPVMTYQPVSRSADLGAPVVLTAVSAGDGLTWQWLKNDVLIPGATLNSLSLTPFTASAPGSYRAVATNSFGSTSSEAAVVTLLSPGPTAPSFIAQPSDQTFVVGLSLQIPAPLVSPGSSTPRYQWLKNGMPIGNVPTLNFIPSKAGDAGTYQLIVTNDYGSAISREIVIRDSISPVGPTFPPFFAAGNPTLLNGTFRFVAPTLAGQNYRVESSVSLASGTWTLVETFVGDGSPRLCSYPLSGQEAFYRVLAFAP